MNHSQFTLPVEKVFRSLLDAQIVSSFSIATLLGCTVEEVNQFGVQPLSDTAKVHQLEQLLERYKKAIVTENISFMRQKLERVSEG
jgi:hypothetical protein